MLYHFNLRKNKQAKPITPYVISSLSIIINSEHILLSLMLRDETSRRVVFANTLRLNTTEKTVTESS